MKKTQKPKTREKLVFKVAEAAARLGISKPEVLGLLDSGRLHAVDVGSGTRKYWRIFAESLERLKKAKNGPSATKAKTPERPNGRIAARCSGDMTPGHRTGGGKSP